MDSQESVNAGIWSNGQILDPCSFYKGCTLIFCFPVISSKRIILTVIMLPLVPYSESPVVCSAKACPFSSCLAFLFWPSLTSFSPIICFFQKLIQVGLISTVKQHSNVQSEHSMGTECSLNPMHDINTISPEPSERHQMKQWTNVALAHLLVANYATVEETQVGTGCRFHQN